MPWRLFADITACAEAARVLALARRGKQRFLDAYATGAWLLRMPSWPVEECGFGMLPRLVLGYFGLLASLLVGRAGKSKMLGASNALGASLKLALGTVPSSST